VRWWTGTLRTIKRAHNPAVQRISRRCGFSLTLALAAERNNELHREGAMRLRIRERNVPGWRNEDLFDPMQLPFFCSACAIMFEGNLLGNKVACPKCNATNSVPYNSDRLCLRKGQQVFEWNVAGDAERRLELTDGDYLCPGCGRPNMTFVDVGCWD
jgi:hypothetical protein